MTKQASVDPGKAIVDPATIQGPCRADKTAWHDPLNDWRPSCLGGWCGRRQSCWHHVGPQRLWLSERICRRGDTRDFQPIPIQQEQA